MKRFQRRFRQTKISTYVLGDYGDHRTTVDKNVDDALFSYVFFDDGNSTNSDPIKCRGIKALGCNVDIIRCKLKALCVGDKLRWLRSCTLSLQILSSERTFCSIVQVVGEIEVSVGV